MLGDEEHLDLNWEADWDRRWKWTGKTILER